MARMHSRDKGKAGSTKPSQMSKPAWLTYSSKEVEMIIVKLHKEKKTPSQIGTILRDVYGIPDVSLILEKSLTKVLSEKDLLPDTPEDLMSLIKKSIAIRKHLENNAHDQPAKRGLRLTESKINRLARYYKAKHVLPSDWKYDPEKVRLLV